MRELTANRKIRALVARYRNAWDSFMETLAVVYCLIRYTIPEALVFAYQKLRPYLDAIGFVLGNLFAILWFLSPFNWVLGKKGTQKLLSKKKRHDSKTKWINFDPYAFGASFALSLIFTALLLPSSTVVKLNNMLKTSPSTIVSLPEEEPSPKTTKPTTPYKPEPPVKVTGEERYFYMFDFESNYKSYLSEEEFDILTLCVQHEAGRSGSIFVDCQDFGQIQRALAKSFLNNRGNLGVYKVAIMIGNTTMFSNLQDEIFTIYEILKNGGTTEDLRSRGIRNPEAYALDDKVTRNNILTVLDGIDDIPKMALYWRNEEANSEEEAWELFRSDYSEDAELYNYLTVKVIDNNSPYGYNYLVFSEDYGFTRPLF